MKNDILDDTTKSIFQDQLLSNEKVIWEGQPSLNWISIVFQFALINAGFIFILIDSDFNQPEIIIVSISSIIFLLIFINQYYKISKTSYLISDLKVHFKFRDFFQDTFMAIPLHEIKDLSINRHFTNFNYCSITLLVDNDEIKNEIKQLSGNSHLVLESIHHAKEMIEYLDLGIQGRL